MRIQRNKSRFSMRTTARLLMLLGVAALLSTGLEAKATETIPEGAYDKDDYMPVTIGIGNVNTSDQLDAAHRNLTQIMEKHWFCAGDKIIFHDTDPNEAKNRILCHMDYDSNETNGHALQALIDMGVIKVTCDGNCISSIEFIDPTKMVALGQGTGSSGSDSQGYSFVHTSLKPLAVWSTALDVSYAWPGNTGEIPSVSVDGGQASTDNTEVVWQDASPEDLPKKIYPLISSVSGNTIDFSVPAAKGKVFSGASVTFSGVGNNSTINDDYSQASLPAVYVGPMQVKTSDLMNYNDKTIYNSAGVYEKDGKYAFRVLSKVMLQMYFSDQAAGGKVITFTYHGQGAKVGGLDERIVYFPRTLLTEMKQKYCASHGYNENYDLTYDVIAQLAGEVKRDGYKLTGWAFKQGDDVENPFVPLDPEKVANGLYKSECFFVDTYSGNADFYAVWEHVDHKWDAGKVTKAATATQDGVKTYTCTVCNATKTETIAKTGTTQELPAKPQPETTETVLPKTGTVLASKDGKANFEVIKSAAGKVEVSVAKPTIAQAKAKTLTIGATVTLKDGTKAKVTKVKAKAYRKNKKLKELTIGKNVTKVDTQAFYGCENLKKITVKSAKVKFGKKALKNLNKGKKVTVYYPKNFTAKQVKSLEKKLKNAGLTNMNLKKK